MKKLTKEEFVKRAKLVHGNKYDYSLVEYKNNRTKVKIKCNKCGNIFEQIPSNHIHKTSKQGCPFCYGNVKTTTEEFIQKSKQIWGENVYDYSEVNYVNNRIKVKLKCIKHNNIFFQSPKKHYIGQGCKFCEQKSKGEDIIDKLLTENNILFIREYRFKDCKYKNVLPFDFYLPKYNTVIEFQGIQHFEQNKRNKHETLEERKVKDQIKRDYCKTNKIKEIEIRYDENILTKLIDCDIIKQKEEKNG